MFHFSVEFAFIKLVFQDLMKPGENSMNLLYQQTDQAGLGKSYFIESVDVQLEWHQESQKRAS